MWSGPSDVPPTTRIAMLAPSLQPSEARVVESIVADPDAAVERTAQEIADAVGVGRASVTRTAQTLGYDGYPQLRVALARELALGAPGDGAADGTLLGAVRHSVERFAARVSHTVSALREEDLEQFVRVLDESDRVLVAANGLSSPLGLDLAMRLTSAGRAAEYLPDTLGQQIAAAQLRRGCACVVVSGSGSNRATLDVMSAARTTGATVLAITSFPRSAAAERADGTLVVAPIEDSFRDELVHTSRAALTLVTEAVVALLIARRGPRAQAAQAATLAAIARSIAE